MAQGPPQYRPRTGPDPVVEIVAEWPVNARADGWGAAAVIAHRKIAFRCIADAALARADAIVRRWLPDGRREGAEMVCRNPTRDDRRCGSFKVNLATGKWSDFATGHRGGDLVSLGAYLFKLSQANAALKVADMIGVEPYDPT
jgi:hypothetical protein